MLISVKDLMDYLKMNDIEFASELGLKERTIRNWRTRKVKPSCDALRIVHDYFKKNEIPYHIMDINW